MSTREQLRAKARETLGGGIFKNEWLILLLVFLVASAILAAASSLFVVVELIVAGPIWIGIYTYMLKYIRKENELKKLEPLLDGFKNDVAGNIILGLLQQLFIFLWALLFAIPGIVKSYSYAMAYYIKVDNPSINGNDAITESRKMMDGHKLDLFLLDLSFLGWILLGLVTFGIGLLWVIPYMQTAHLRFYEELKAEYAAKNAKAATSDENADAQPQTDAE